MKDFIRFVLSNFTLTFLVIGLIASAIALYRKKSPHQANRNRGDFFILRIVLDRRGSSTIS